MGKNNNLQTLESMLNIHFGCQFSKREKNRMESILTEMALKPFDHEFIYFILQKTSQQK